MNLRRFGIELEEMLQEAPWEIRSLPEIPRWKPRVGLGFIIKSHDLDTVRNGERLIQWMYHPGYSFAWHLDLEGVSDSVGCYLLLKYAKYKNIRFVKRTHAPWGTHGNTKAELDGYRLLMTMPGWAYAINLSGSTLPLMPSEAMNCWIHSRLYVPGSHGVIDRQVENCCSYKNPAARSNYDRTSATCSNRECTVMNGTPRSLPWWKGSEWKIMSHKLVEYVLTDPLANLWHDFFRDQGGKTLNEAWATTIATYSPFRDNITFRPRRQLDRTLMYVEWAGDKCTFPNPRPDSSPCFLGELELQKILSANALFARKFYFRNGIADTIKTRLVLPQNNSLVKEYCGSLGA